MENGKSREENPCKVRASEVRNDPLHGKEKRRKQERKKGADTLHVTSGKTDVRR